MEESPKVLYVHYMGHGPAVQLATSLRDSGAFEDTAGKARSGDRRIRAGVGQSRGRRNNASRLPGLW
jgi:hypothetical protein